MGISKKYKKLFALDVAITMAFMWGCDSQVTEPTDEAEITFTQRPIIYSGTAENALNAQQGQAEQLPTRYYCLVSTLNPEGGEKAYTYTAYNLHISKKLLKKRKKGKEDQWIRFIYANPSAIARHEADSALWKKGGIVRMARCRVPALPKVIKKVKSQFHRYSPQSWLYQHQKELKDNGKANEALPDMECALWERDFKCDVIGNEVYNCRWTGPIRCISWVPVVDDHPGGGGSSSGNDSDVCETEPGHDEPTPGDPTPGGTPGNPTPVGCVDEPEPDPCDTGDPIIDANEEMFQVLWENSNVNKPIEQRTEQGGFITMNSNGEYVFVPFPSGWPTFACGISPPQGWQSAIPSNTVGYVHTHPFFPGDNTKSVCGEDGTENYTSGTNAWDLDFLAHIQNYLSNYSIKGYILDGGNIVTYGTLGLYHEDNRCGY